jgi:hypothetical protein
MTDALTRGRQYSAEVKAIKARAQSLRDRALNDANVSPIDYTLLCRLADRTEAKELREEQVKYRRDLRSFASRSPDIRVQHDCGAWIAINVNSNSISGPVGRGATDEEAIDNLLDQLEDDAFEPFPDTAAIGS